MRFCSASGESPITLIPNSADSSNEDPTRLDQDRAASALLLGQRLQAVGQLAGGLAHDVNNALATVLGNLELLERRLPPEDERARLWISRAMTAVQLGAQSTSRLLAFSRRQRLAARPTDINLLVTDLVNLIRPTLGGRIKVETDLSPALWSSMLDRSQIEAAIFNLVLNARDAMPDGGALTMTTENLSVADDAPVDGLAAGDYVRVIVSDTGSGMSGAILRQAFEPFFTTRGPTHPGLGLTQVFGTMQQSRGVALLRSDIGVGTSVTLAFPRHIDPSAEAIRSAGETGSPSRMPGTVLLVDDDHAVLDVTGEMLRSAGTRVIQASGGAEALRILDGLSDPVDAFVLDYAMPGMTGRELASAIRRRGLSAPIIIVTGYAELAEPAEDDGATIASVLRKPFSFTQIQAALSEAMPAP